jgi:hypothetical protein
LQAAQFQLLVKMRSPKLFAWAGLETWSSRSLLPEELGLQVWDTSFMAGRRVVLLWGDMFDSGEY